MGGGLSGTTPREIIEPRLALGNIRNRVPLYSFWNHCKTGHTYQVTGHCIIEATLQPAILYTRLGVTFCRPSTEFLDGRFEEWTEG